MCSQIGTWEGGDHHHALIDVVSSAGRICTSEGGQKGGRRSPV